jgi:hypothetical protein
MEVSGQRHVPAALPPKVTQVPIVVEAGWAPETIWAIWRKASTGIQTPDRSVVITTTELGRPLSRHLHFVSYHHAGVVRGSNLVLASVNGLQTWPLLV